MVFSHRLLDGMGRCFEFYLFVLMYFVLRYHYEITTELDSEVHWFLSYLTWVRCAPVKAAWAGFR